MTIDEALAASVIEPVNDIFEIDPETRVITVPASEKLFGVANDGNSERKHFRCPKIVGDCLPCTCTSITRMPTEINIRTW